MQLDFAAYYFSGLWTGFRIGLSNYWWRDELWCIEDEYEDSEIEFEL